MVKAWRAFSAFALLAAIACGDDDGSGPTGSISVTAAPASLTLAQGASGTVTVTLVRGGGFADPVNVAVTGLPSGVTLSVTPAQLTGTTTQAVVTVNVASTVPAGTYTATVTATATGVGSATATYTLTVTATPNYALSATAVSVGQGGSGTSTISVTRTNFTSPVTLTLESPPAGITGSFNPSPATGDQSVLTLNVASTVATGSYNLTVKGTATGQTDKTTTVALTVTAPGNFTIAATPSALSLAAGASGNTSVAIVRTNFTTDVALSLVSPPTGITGVFTPATLTGATLTSTLALSVAANVAAGTYPVTVRGTGGSVTQNATVNVTVTAAAGNFTISATPAAVTIGAGASGNTSVAIVRTNFTTDVALSLVSPPTGITGVFTPATLTGATLTSTLAVSVAANVAAGTYPVTVRGTAGSVTQDATVTVTVTAAGNFTISATPATLSLAAGASGNTSVAIVRTNFTTDVALSLVSPPTGITGVFTPATLTGATLSSTLALSVASNVAAGTYPVTVRGTGGAVTQNTTVNVTVTAPSGGNLVWEFCNSPAGSVPVKFWFLNGATWTEVTGVVVGTVTRFSFNLPTGSTGIAYTASASGFSTTIVYFTQSTELGSFAAVCTTPTTVQKTFNLTGQVGGEVGQLGYGGAGVATGAAASYNVTVAPGTYDWLWAFGTQSGLPPTTTYANYRIGRSEATSAGAVSVNRTGAPAFVTAPFSFTGGSVGGFWQTSQSLSGANGQITTLSIGSILSGNGSGNMLFLQPGDRLGTDIWLLSATHLEIDQAGKGDSRTSARYVGSAPPASLTFALPGKVPAFTVTSSSASIPWNAAGSIPAEYQTATSTVAASFNGAGGNATATLIATRGWLVANNMSTSYTLSGPTLPNFLAAWAPASPLTASSVIMTGTNLTGAPTAGGFLNTAVRIQ